MRNILGVMLLFILLGAGVAQADEEWTDKFIAEYDDFGMSSAVETALSNDITPNEILTFIISNSDKFEEKKGLKALYCAGADRDAVREAANKLGITVQDVSASLEESIAECGDKKTLTDRDIIDNDGPGGKIGLSERDIAPPPDLPEPPVQEPPLPEQVAPPARPRPSSPAAP